MKLLKLHSTGRAKLAPPPPRASVRVPGRNLSLLEEIRELPEDKCRLSDGRIVKEEFIRFVEDRCDEATNKPRPMFRWTTRHEAWVDFLLEWKHRFPPLE